MYAFHALKLGLMLLFVLHVLEAPAVGEPPAAKEKKEAAAPATPEEAVRRFMEAWKAQDVAAAIELTPKSYRDVIGPRLLAASKAAQAHQAYSAALMDKFGKGGDYDHSPRLPWYGALQWFIPRWSFLSIEMAEKAGSRRGDSVIIIVTFTIKGAMADTTEKGRNGFRAVKESTGWKCIRIDRTFTDYLDEDLKVNDSAELRAELQSAIKTDESAQQAFEKTTAEIKEGKYRTREEALEAVGLAIKAAFRAAFEKSSK